MLLSACGKSSNLPNALLPNTAPQGADGSVTTAEDTPLMATLSASDPDGDTITVTVTDDVDNGTLTIVPDGMGGFMGSYTANADFNGIDTFSFTVSDGSLSAGPFTVSITVTPVNDAPLASNAAVNVNEDAVLSGMLPAVDVDGDALTIMAGGNPANGALLVNADGSYMYTPNANFNGADQFTYNANDGTVDSNLATVTVTVAAVNDAPVAVGDTYATAEDVPLVVNGVLDNDSDIDGDALTAVLAGAPANGALALNADGSFTYAPNANFNGMDALTYMANDGTVDSPAATVMIAVSAVNDAPVANAQVVTAVEDTPVNVMLSGSDVENDALIFALASMPTNGTVNGFNPATGMLTYTPNTDFAGTDSFTFRVNDATFDSMDGTVMVTVTPVNDPPTDIALDSTNVDEEQSSGTAVGAFSTADVDVADTHTYTLTAGAGDTDNASFAIVGGQLRTAAALDFETQNSFSVRVLTDDGAGGTFEQAFAITVNDINEAPTDIALDNTSVDENQPAGTPVGSLTSTDQDASATHAYSLVAGAGDADNASFSIAGAQVQTTAALDFETQNSFAVRIQTDDGAGGTFEEAFTITVNDVNEAPTDIALDRTDVDENQPTGTPVGNFTSTDVDSAGPFTYTLVAGAGDTDNVSFGIVGDQLQTAAAFDFETQSSFAVRVQTDDGAGGTFEAAFTITVNDLNDPPTDIALDSTDVDEGQPIGTAVGTFTSTDVDSAGPFTYMLVAGAGDADNAAFGIAADQLQTASVFDASVQNSFSIRVQTDDGAGGTFEEAFAITVNSLNDPPTDIALDSTDVDENQAAGTAVGTFSTTDPNVGDTHTYGLVAGVGDTDNASFAIVGDQLQTAAVFDFETQDTFSIRVETDDGAGDTFEEAFTITVNDLNDDPTDISLDSTDVGENLAVGSPVANLSTTDADTADTHTYSLVIGTGDTDNASFAVVGSQLQTAATLNFEATDSCVTSVSTCSIRLATNDGNGGVFEEAFTIGILDVNDLPVGVNDPYTGAIGNTLFELVATLSGTTPTPPTVEFVGTVVSNDTDEDLPADPLTTVAGTIASANGGSVVLAADGRFVYTPPVGFTGASDSFLYTVFDGTANSATQATATIAVTDMVWYVDDSAVGAGDGRASTPFQALSSAGTPSMDGEIIFVYAGTQTSGITLKNNQQLLGQGLALVVNATTLVGAGARPAIANAGGTAITVGSSNTIRGLDINGSMRGIVGNGLGTLTVNAASISTSGGAALELSNGTANLSLNSLSSSGSSTSGISLSSLNGSLDLGSGAISGSTGTAFSAATNVATVTYDGTINTTTAPPVSISGQSAGAVTFSGAIASTGQGIELTGNTGGTMTFRGGMTLDTGANTAFNATGGGTVNICADDNCSAAGGTAVTNTATMSTGTAVNIVNTTIGTDGVTFRSIATSGGATGINIDSSGVIGFFTVTGTGTTSGSGGTIQNTTQNGILIQNTNNITLTNMNLTNATNEAAGCLAGVDQGSSTLGPCTAALEFNTVSNINITNMTIDGDGDASDELGVFAQQVSNFDMTGVTVRDVSDAQNEHGIYVVNLLGTAGASTDSNWHDVVVENSVGDTGILIVQTNGTGELLIDGASRIEDALEGGFEARTDNVAANLTVTIGNASAVGVGDTVVIDNTAIGAAFFAQNGTLTGTVRNSILRDGSGVATINRPGSITNGVLFVGVTGQSSGATADVILNVTGSDIDHEDGGAGGTGRSGIALGGSGNVNGTITNNTVDSNDEFVDGFFMNFTGVGTTSDNQVTISNNSFNMVGSGGNDTIAGIEINASDSAGGLFVTVTDNAITSFGDNGFSAGMVFVAGDTGGGDSNTLCVDVTGNNATTPTAGAFGDYGFVQFSNATLNIEGVGPGVVSDAQVDTYITTTDAPAATTTGADINATAGTINGVASCP